MSTSSIRTYKSNEIESVRLHLFANACNTLYIERGMLEEIRIKDIYFDHGQNWMYTAPVTYEFAKGDSWQSVCPRDYEIIINCDSVADILRYADYYVTSRMNNDICIDISKVA